MDEGRWGLCGGIAGLTVLLDDEEKRAAIEADLIDRGMRLRWFPSPDYSWRDLYVIVKHLGQESNFGRVSIGDDAVWTFQAQLQATMVDYLRLLFWTKTKDGSKGRNPPKPIPRPGVDDGAEKKKIGGNTVLPAEQMRAALGM